MENPFTLIFGKNPQTSIDRPVQENEIVNAFQSSSANQQLFIITGIRGCGKTVLMTDVAKKLTTGNDAKSWVHVELNPTKDLLESLLSKLNSSKKSLDILKNAKLNLSAFGFSVSFDGAVKIKDPEVAIAEILGQFKKQNKRLLITIDEVANTSQMRTFASTFQILVREDLPVFLLMTGLLKNIDDLQNEDNLTFLHRAPKIHLPALNLGEIARSYKKVFSLDANEANEMAALTRGYAFAFQVLGYLTFEAGGKYEQTHEQVIDKYEFYLSEYVYDKIWSEMSPKDREVAQGIAKAGEGATQKIREQLNMSQNEFNPYRKRLIKKGVLYSDVRGSVRFTLPLFDEYVLEN